MLTVCALSDTPATVILAAGIPHYKSNPVLNLRGQSGRRVWEFAFGRARPECESFGERKDIHLPHCGTLDRADVRGGLLLLLVAVAGALNKGCVLEGDVTVLFAVTEETVSSTSMRVAEGRVL